MCERYGGVIGGGGGVDKRKKGSTTYRVRTALPALTAGRTAARENIVNGKKSRTGGKVQEKRGQQVVVTGRPQRSIEWAETEEVVQLLFLFIRLPAHCRTKPIQVCYEGMTEQTSYATIPALYYRHQGNFFQVSASARAGETPESQKVASGPPKRPASFSIPFLLLSPHPQPFFSLFSLFRFVFSVYSLSFSPLLASYTTFFWPTYMSSPFDTIVSFLPLHWPISP